MVYDSVFSGVRHLNWMDKITSQVIQMDSNFRSLNSRVSDVRVSNSRALDVRVSEALGHVGLGGLGHESRRPRILVLSLEIFSLRTRDVVSEA
jgi:hypothetical protein